MTAAVPLPDEAAVQRYRSLTLQHWAAPGNGLSAASATRSLLGSLCRVSERALVIGLRPARIAGQLERCADTRIARLAAAAAGIELQDGIRDVPVASMLEYIEAGGKGMMSLRDAGGATADRPRVVHASAGVPAIVVGARHFAHAQAGAALAAGMQRFFSVMTNPMVMFSQRDAKAVRAWLEGMAEDVVVTWPAATGTTLTVLGNARALSCLWRSLHEQLVQPAED